jgi:hypothetical protein
MRIFVLLFNARTENEGIHTMQMGDRNKVLMFESEDDALRYSLLLEAQDFPCPTVEAMDSEEIEEFCESAGYDYQIVQEGMLAIPPENNVEETQWQPGEKRETQPMTNASELSQEELERFRRKLEGLI